MKKSLDDVCDDLFAELSDDTTTHMRLKEIATLHTVCNNCEICIVFRENIEDISCLIAKHFNCDDETLTVLLDWARQTGDNGYEVDILLRASGRSNFSGRWFEYVLDKPWSSTLQFEGSLHYDFISNLLGVRELTNEEKNRIVIANDLLEFPSEEELEAKGYGDRRS